MRFTDVFIRRVVLSVVVSVLILVAGVRSYLALPVQQYPSTISATITISTAYYGADAATMAGFITTPLESVVSQAPGIDYMTSISQTGQSTITLTLKLNQNPNATLAQVQAYASSIQNQLPPGTQAVSISVANNTNGIMFASASSRVLPPEQVGDWVARVLSPQIQAVPGVQNVSVQGSPNLALRVWLKPDRLSSYGLTATDAVTALSNNDYVTGVGQTLGGTTYVNLAINSGLHSVDSFRNLVVARTGTALVRLSDVADVAVGPDATNSENIGRGGEGSFIQVNLTPGANLLTVARGVEAVFARVERQLPPGIDLDVLYDASTDVLASRHEVIVSLAEAMAIVGVVIFLFLGSLRSLVIPLVTIPLSLIGTFALMALFGFSINSLTLLAMVLAIGLVVDDAIIVVENVNRHLADGMRPLPAAVLAARELGAPILAMTAVLVAAYLPIGLQKGLTGALFTEFAFTLAGSVTVSAVLALTLSPMMCSRILRPHAPGRRGLGTWPDRALAVGQRVYSALLSRVLDVRPLVLVLAACILVSIVYMFRHAAHELVPQEDRGFLLIQGVAPPAANLDQLALWDPMILKAYHSLPEQDGYWIGNAPNSIFDGFILKPWNERHRTTSVVQTELQDALNKVAGIELAVFQPSDVPGSGGGLPVQFVLQGTGSIDTLASVSDRMILAARRSGLFAYIDKDLKIDQPQTTIVLDRARLAELGLDVATIGNQLNNLLGGVFVNYYSRQERSYKVEPLVVRDRRLNADQILDYPIANLNGVPIPLSAVATLSHQVVPEQINHFQQLTATTLSGIPMPGVSLGRAYAFLQDLARADLPAGFATDTAGGLREYVNEQGAFLPTFAFAMIIIYLALAALFESFRDPLVIMVSVPMSIAGALLFIWLGVGGASINLYSEIGLVTLAGLISKHGILIVEVANEQQILGRTKRDAIERAAALRLRPILMTTAAMVLGVLPLVFATGAGAAARYVMGLVIATGLGIGTIFTLFVVPTVYMFVAARHEHAEIDGPLPTPAAPMV